MKKEHAGKSMHCPSCNTVILVPSIPADSATAELETYKLDRSSEKPSNKAPARPLDEDAIPDTLMDLTDIPEEFRSTIFQTSLFAVTSLQDAVQSNSQETGKTDGLKAVKEWLDSFAWSKPPRFSLFASVLMLLQRSGMSAAQIAGRIGALVGLWEALCRKFDVGFPRGTERSFDDVDELEGVYTLGGKRTGSVTQMIADFAALSTLAVEIRELATAHADLQVLPVVAADILALSGDEPSRANAKSACERFLAGERQSILDSLQLRTDSAPTTTIQAIVVAAKKPPRAEVAQKSGCAAVLVIVAVGLLLCGSVLSG
ncbi:MAG: hypothetical protein AB7O26_07525 [Planctomycetaceae bacterium]